MKELHLRYFANLVLIAAVSLLLGCAAIPDAEMGKSDGDESKIISPSASIYNVEPSEVKLKFRADVQRGELAYFVESILADDFETLTNRYGMAGVVYANNGMCISASVEHLIPENVVSVQVSHWGGWSNNAVEKANVIARIPKYDLAFLSHRCLLKSNKSIKMRNNRPELLSDLVTFGQPVANRGVASKGIVSSYWPSTIEHNFIKLISTVTSVEGFSGGPVYDKNGYYSGMIFGRSPSTNGYAYILPSEYILEELMHILEPSLVTEQNDPKLDLQ